MIDDMSHKDRIQQKAPGQGLGAILQSKEPEGDATEVGAHAFGYLRGIRDQSSAVEFRFRTGDSIWFPYSWLGNWCFNPSEGLMIKFSGDLVYVVLIKGSNLDRPLAETNTNLTSSGLQRHRIVWMREMSDEEIRQVGESEPTIDSIEIQEFETHAALNDWLRKKAPAFLLRNSDG